MQARNRCNCWCNCQLIVPASGKDSVGVFSRARGGGGGGAGGPTSFFQLKIQLFLYRDWDDQHGLPHVHHMTCRWAAFQCKAQHRPCPSSARTLKNYFIKPCPTLWVLIIRHGLTPLMSASCAGRAPCRTAAAAAAAALAASARGCGSQAAATTEAGGKGHISAAASPRCCIAAQRGRPHSRGPVKAEMEPAPGSGFEAGMVVWSQLAHFPWWPSQVRPASILILILSYSLFRRYLLHGRCQTVCSM